MKGSVLLVLVCATAALAEETFEASTAKIAMSVYGDCSKTEDFYVCLKKKAITMLDKLERSKNFSISDSVKVVRHADFPEPIAEITENNLEDILPRSTDGKNAVLSEMLSKKVNGILGSSTIEISLPRTFPADEDDEEDDSSEEARFGFGKKKKKKKKGKKKGGFGGILMLVGAKILIIKSLLMAGIFLLAKKALIIAKIALAVSGFLVIKKLLAAKGKQGGMDATHVFADLASYSGGHGGSYIGGGGGGGYSDGGHDGWSSGGHSGGWGRMAVDTQSTAYSAYVPKH